MKDRIIISERKARRLLERCGERGFIKWCVVTEERTRKKLYIWRPRNKYVYWEEWVKGE